MIDTELQQRIKLDHDYIDQLEKEKAELLSAIRKHRDYRGDDKCHLDDRELYAILPEGYAPPIEDSCVELERCKKYIASRRDPAITYVSPQRMIEKLEHKISGSIRVLNYVLDSGITDEPVAKALKTVLAGLQDCCPKCGGQMKPGMALHSEMLVARSRDGAFGVWEGSTCSYINGHAQMIDCLKCEKCGCSVLAPAA